MKKELFIPFNRNGNMLDYSYWGISEEEKEICKENGKVEHYFGNGEIAEVFVPNFEFEDELVFEKFSRGRSSVKAHFISCTNDKRYEMFISDFGDVIREGHLIGDRIMGKFSFVKKGQNYGVVLLKGGEQE